MSGMEYDHDDVDLYVSPRTFGGRTPSAAAMRAKVFAPNAPEDDWKVSAKPTAATLDLDRNTNPNHDAELGDAKAYNREGSIAQGLAQQAKVRKAVSYSNWFAVVVGLCAVGMSIYAFLDANDPGVVSYLSTEGTFLTSPVKYGGMLLGAGIGTVALAILGITQIADELASRFFHGTKHVLYRVYLVLAAWSLALFAGVGSASLGLMLKTTSNSDVQRFLRLSTAASAIGCLTLVIVMTIPYASRAF